MKDKAPPQHVNLFFRLAAGAAGLFVVTILAFTATLFGDSRSPVASLLQHNAGAIFLGELGALIALGIAAMAVDRRQSLRYAGGERATGETSQSDAPSAPGSPGPSAIGEGASGP